MKAFDVPTCTSFESIDRYVCTVAQVDILDMHIALDFEIRVYEENSKPQVFNKNKKNDFNRRERDCQRGGEGRRPTKRILKALLKKRQTQKYN